MSEIGSHATVGIERVEWLDAGGSHLTVRVTGRWRRRRGWAGSEARGPTTLIIEAGGRRHRFPAMPEPPSLAGAAPGTWRLSFSVPSELRPEGGADVWLSLGSVTVPLPVPDSAGAPVATDPAESEAVAPPEPVAPAADVVVRAPETVAPEPPVPEPPVPETRPGADEPTVAPQDPAPAPPPPGPESGPASLEIERAWRRADVAERTTAELGARLAELERALASERRDRATASETVVTGRERERLALEDALRARRETGPVRVPAEPLTTDATPVVALTAVAPPESDLVTALRRELDTRVAAEARLRARVVQAETRLAARVLLEQRTTSALRELRSEFETLRAALATERTARAVAEQEVRELRAELGGQRERSRDAYEAIGELRGALDRLPPGGAGVGPGHGPGPVPVTVPDDGDDAPATTIVTPERLSDALARLRQGSEPRDPAPALAEPPAPALPGSGASATPGRPTGALGRSTLEPAIRRLAGRDVGQAGRLLLDLLGAQRAAHPDPVAYDLVLGPGHGCIQVTVGPNAATVVAAGAARAREQVDFQLVGDPARVVRRLLAGRLRRVVPLGLARVRGRRGGVAVLQTLLALPLDLGGLHAAGMRLDPESLLALVAAMIEPAWTREERFTLAHTDEHGATVYLQIRDGRPPLVTRVAPEGRVATALHGSADALLASLTGAEAPSTDAGLSGDRGPLTLLREWVNRAQCG